MAIEKIGPEMHTVVLPCDPDHFREFMAGLLGQPQTIHRDIFGSFELSRADVENLFHLIEQRVRSQNDAKLIQFTARIIYDDNSSVMLNSFADFQAYNEVKPLVSVSAVFSWTYLIVFQGKQYPEKQVIEINFGTRQSNFVRIREGVTFHEERLVRSSMGIRISHTNRTWGTDIEALLVGQLGTLRKREIGIRAFVVRHSGWIGLAVGILVFVSALAMAFRVTDAFISQYLSEAQKIVTTGDITFETVAKKLDFLTAIVASGMWTRYAFYVTGFFIMALIASIVTGGVVGASAGTVRPSFVLLTRRSDHEREIGLAQYRNSWLIFIFSLVGAVAVSVVGNWIFFVMSRYWTS
jgi:hypothetical protein